MGRIRSLGILFLLGLFVPPLLCAEIYKWVDERGTVHFTDDYTKIPEKYRKKKLHVIKETPQTSSPQEPASSSPSKDKQKASVEQSGEKSGESEAVERDKAGHDRAWWQTQVEEWRRKKNQAIEERKAVEARYQVLVRRANNPAFGRRGRQTLEGEVKELEERLTKLQLTINEADDMLEKKLPAQAAKAGAPPEWLQESGTR